MDYQQITEKIEKVILSCTNNNQLIVGYKYCSLLIDKEQAKFPKVAWATDRFMEHRAHLWKMYDKKISELTKNNTPDEQNCPADNKEIWDLGYLM